MLLFKIVIIFFCCVDLQHWGKERAAEISDFYEIKNMLQLKSLTSFYLNKELKLIILLKNSAFRY